MNKTKKKKNKKRKCKHEVDGYPCPECGYEEGECRKCGKYVYGNEFEGYEE